MTGVQLKNEGMARVDRAIDSEWKFCCDQIIRLLARNGQEFSSEDVRDWVGEPSHYNAWGVRFRDAVRAGVIRKTGYTAAKRPEAHARIIATYRGATA